MTESGRFSATPSVAERSPRRRARQEPAAEIFDETFDEAPEVVTADEAVEADEPDPARAPTEDPTPSCGDPRRTPHPSQ